MSRTKKLSLRPKIVYTILGSACVVLIIVSFRYERVVSPVRNAVNTVLTPMQKGINSIGSSISGKLDTFADIEDLQKENAELKDEIESLKYENKTLLQDKYELEGLRKLYELDQKYPDYPKVAARVIEKDASNWYSEFKIDKGSEDGMKVNMNVIAGKGLVGIITHVGKNYATVRSIIDENSSVTGMFLKTSDFCVVDGSLESMHDGVLPVSEIPKNAKVKEGFEVVTSNMSDRYLSGILVGYVSNISVDAGNMTKSAVLTPVVDFTNIEQVLVITELKEQLEENETVTTE